MKALHTRGYRPLNLVVSKCEPGPVAGPGLSAVRASADLWSDGMARFAPVFERIGRSLDAAVCQPGPDQFFTAEKRQIVVAISDASWSDTAVLAAYSEHDLRLISAAAGKAFKAIIRDCKIAGADANPKQTINVLLANWTGPALASIRDNDTCSPPDLPVGTLFTCFAGLRGQLDAVAAGETPVPAIALNSIGSTRRHPKCSLRAVVFPLPAWAGASGAVAGNA